MTESNTGPEETAKKKSARKTSNGDLKIREGWWNGAQPPAQIRSDSHEWVFQWAQQCLALKALEGKCPAPLRVGGAGPVAHSDVYFDLKKILEEEVQARPVEEAFFVWDDDFEEVFIWKDGAAFITSADESTQLGVNVVTTDYDFAEKIRQFLHTNIHKTAKTNRGRVYVLSAGTDGVRAVPLGFAAVPLEVENYTPEIQETIKKMVGDMQTPFPDGRLTIFEGPPGCGKTFLIRSLVHEVPGAKFIFIPPAMISSLGDPSLISSLLSLQEDTSHDEEGSYNGPIVLICEDADSILERRGADNMPAVSSVLNLSAGILGDVIDIRVIATTNAPRSNMDPALLRAGRLAAMLTVAPITPSHADSIFKRLMEDPEADAGTWPTARVPNFGKGNVGFQSESGEVPLEGKVLLADVFKLAKSRGWRPKKVKAKVDSVRVKARRPRPYKDEDGASFEKAEAETKS